MGARQADLSARAAVSQSCIRARLISGSRGVAGCAAGYNANGLKTGGEVSPADRGYLAALVSARTGISEPEAANRVDIFISHMKASADSVRKAASAASLFTALSMLIGAFIACAAAALGGRERDASVVPMG